MKRRMECEFQRQDHFKFHVKRKTTWRLNERKVVKTFVKDKEVASVKLDPMRETADIDESNNSWGSIPEPTKFQLFKAKQANARGQAQGINPMQKAAEKKAF